MLQAHESKFSLSLEVRLLWKNLQEQGRLDEFETEFWKTFQGMSDEQTLKRENLVATKVTIEKRPGDLSENVYMECIPVDK